MEGLPYEYLRWIETASGEPAKEEDLILGTDVKLVEDYKGNQLLLFGSQWAVGWTQERNKDLTFLRPPPPAASARRLRGGTTQNIEAGFLAVPWLTSPSLYVAMSVWLAGPRSATKTSPSTNLAALLSDSFS